MLERAPDLANVTYHLADAESWIPARGICYDLVVLSEVLEHLEDPRATIQRYGAIGRYVLASCPITEPLNPLGAFDPDLIGRETRQGDATGHIWAMDWSGLVSLFDGFCIRRRLRVHHSGIILATLCD